MWWLRGRNIVMWTMSSSWMSPKFKTLLSIGSRESTSSRESPISTGTTLKIRIIREVLESSCKPSMSHPRKEPTMAFRSWRKRRTPTCRQLLQGYLLRELDGSTLKRTMMWWWVRSTWGWLRSSSRASRFPISLDMRYRTSSRLYWGVMRRMEDRWSHRSIWSVIKGKLWRSQISS